LRHGFELSLELGVLFFQLGDSLPLLFVLLPLLVELSLQALLFPLQAVDLPSLPFEKSGKATRE